MRRHDGIAQAWKAIEKRLAKLRPELLQSLAPPAPAESVAKLEAAAGLVLPAEFKESLAIHDGQKPGAETGEYPAFYADDECGSYFLLGVRGMLRDWRMFCSVEDAGDFEDAEAAPDPGVAEVWWSRGWVPFAGKGGGECLCLDMAPGAGGVPGQVIRFRHDAPARQLLAASYAEWLTQQADAISRGHLPG